MSKPIEPDAPGTDIESTESVTEYAPLPNEIHEPQIPPQTEVDEPSVRSPADVRRYMHLQSTAAEGEREPGHPLSAPCAARCSSVPPHT